MPYRKLGISIDNLDYYESKTDDFRLNTLQEDATRTWLGTPRPHFFSPQMKNLKTENEQFKQSAARIQSEYEQLQQSSALLEAEIEKLKRAPAKPVPDLDRQLREARDLKNEIEMLRAEKQKLLDGEASSKQKVWKIILISGHMRLNFVSLIVRRDFLS